MGYSLLLRNVPALAYSSDTTLLPCSLVIKCSTVQAAIIVNVSTHPHGSNDAQSFDLTYNADNLVPGRTFLGPAPETLSPDQLSKITRPSTASTIRTLYLTLHAPCPVRCSPSTGCIAPKPGHEARFRQLRDIASSTEIHVVFDGNWLHEQHYAIFHRLINRPRDFAGIPVANYNGPLSRQADWTVFSPVDDAQPEAPPSYDNVPRKRARSCTSSPPQQPRAKRERALSPMPELALPWSGAGTPTEKATSVESDTPSPRYLMPPYNNGPGYQDATKATLDADVLAHVLAALDPLINERVNAAVESSVKSVHSKAIEEGCTQAVEQMSGELLTRVCSKTLKQVQQKALDDGFDQRADADYTFFSELEDHKLDVTIAKNEALDEIRHEYDTKLDDLRTTAEETVARCGTELQKKGDEMWEMLDGVSWAKRSTTLGHIREAAEREQAALYFYGRHHRPPTLRPSAVAAGQRATSLPL